MEKIKRLAYNGKVIKNTMGVTFWDTKQFDGQKTKEEVEKEKQLEQEKEEKRKYLDKIYL